MHFPRIPLVEQTEQKFRRFESVVKKRVTDSRALLLIKAPTKNRKFHLLSENQKFSFTRQCT